MDIAATEPGACWGRGCGLASVRRIAPGRRRRDPVAWLSGVLEPRPALWSAYGADRRHRRPGASLSSYVRPSLGLVARRILADALAALERTLREPTGVLLPATIGRPGMIRLPSTDSELRRRWRARRRRLRTARLYITPNELVRGYAAYSLDRRSAPLVASPATMVGCVHFGTRVGQWGARVGAPIGAAWTEGDHDG